MSNEERLLYEAEELLKRLYVVCLVATGNPPRIAKVRRVYTKASLRMRRRLAVWMLLEAAAS